MENEEFFELFWQMYPKKVGKKYAYKCWQKADLSQLEQIYDGLRKWRKSAQWQADDGKYIPNPSTFLNQERWNDEVPQEIDLKNPQTEKEVFAVLFLNEFGIKNHLQSITNLLNCYKANRFFIEQIYSYCADIAEVISVISQIKRDMEYKGFNWSIPSIAKSFPYYLENRSKRQWVE